MQILEPGCAVLSTVSEALQVCQQNRDVPRDWNDELKFSSRLKITLESIAACSPIDADFTHSQELNLLIQAVLKPLASFYTVLVPYTSSLSRGCEPNAPPVVFEQLELLIKESIIEPLKGLRWQTNTYLQGLDTLLLLYVIDIIYTRQSQVSEQELDELQMMIRAAEVVVSQDVAQLKTLFYSRRLSIEEQQACFMSMRQDVEHHWETVHIAIYGVWWDASNKSKDGLLASKDNRETLGRYKLHSMENTAPKGATRTTGVGEDTGPNVPLPYLANPAAREQALLSSGQSKPHDKKSQRGPAGHVSTPSQKTVAPGRHALRPIRQPQRDSSYLRQGGIRASQGRRESLESSASVPGNQSYELDPMRKPSSFRNDQYRTPQDNIHSRQGRPDGRDGDHRQIPIPNSNGQHDGTRSNAGYVVAGVAGGTAAGVTAAPMAGSVEDGQSGCCSGGCYGGGWCRDNGHSRCRLM